MLGPENTSLLGKAHSFYKVFKLKVIPKIYQLTNDLSIGFCPRSPSTPAQNEFDVQKRPTYTIHLFSPHIPARVGVLIHGNSLISFKIGKLIFFSNRIRLGLFAYNDISMELGSFHSTFSLALCNLNLTTFS